MSKKILFLNIIFFVLINSYISLPSCSEGQNFCTKCNPVTKLCEKCEYNNILIPDATGGCKGAKKCFEGNNYCLKCDSNNELCYECLNNYYQDENGACSYTNNCEISYQGNCLKCKEDYILVGQNIQFCKNLDSEDFLNCEKINTETGLCEKCKEGFFL